MSLLAGGVVRRRDRVERIIAQCEPQRGPLRVQRGQDRGRRLGRVTGLLAVTIREPGANGADRVRVRIEGTGLLQRPTTGEPGPEGSGLHDQRLDTEPGDLLGERLGQPLQGELGCRIGPDARERHPPAHAAHLHDGPGLAVAHVRQHGPRERGRSEEVQLHQVAQLGIGRLLDGADETTARVVHQHVDPAEPLDDLVHDGSDTRRIGDVQGDRHQTVGVRGDQVAEHLGPTSGGHHRVSGAEGGFRDGPPEAGRRTGNEPDAVVLDRHRNSIAGGCHAVVRRA
ncbi:hypothetical protein GCM10020000_31660 [Streptomyces olivoverticillatus]